jgi:hypothetical protein
MAEGYSARKVKPLKVQEKFKLAGLCNYYDTAYRHWSSMSHNDIAGTLFGCRAIDHPILNIRHHRETDNAMNFVQLSVIFEVLENSTRAMVKYLSIYDEPAYASFCDDCHMIADQMKAISQEIANHSVGTRDNTN